MKRTVLTSLLLIFLAGSVASNAQTPVLTEDAKLTPSDGASGDVFGIDVAIDGETLVVGASSDDDLGINSGSAFVFVRSGATWTQEAKLLAIDGSAVDLFGDAVAVSGDTIVVGAAGDDVNGRIDAGSAYVFVRDSMGWTQQAKLIAADPQAVANFGLSVALHGDTAVLGAQNDDSPAPGSGSAYVFVRNSTTWTQQAKLTASDAAAGDEFGSNVGTHGDTIVVGARLDDDNGTDSGAAYIFTRSGSLWTQDTKLTASDGAAGDNFGISVAIDADSVIVGARGDDAPATDSGSAYVFVRNSPSFLWVEQAKLTASDGTAGDFFGFQFAVGISGDLAAVGASYNDDNGSRSGSAYVYERSGSNWVEQTKLLASDAAAGDEFGNSVKISGSTVVIGSFLDDDNGSKSGSAYVFGVCSDNDGDGFGSPGDASCPSGPAEDCNDDDAAINPVAAEICDGVDNDCDGDVDEGFDADGDLIADCFDACPYDADNDADGDAVCGDIDVCDDTVIAEGVPTVRLGVNRFALTTGGSTEFDTRLPPGGGGGPGLAFTTSDTAGCSCEQIIEALELGNGHVKFGCSISAMEAWTALVNP